jgi:hypothetical protein
VTVVRGYRRYKYERAEIDVNGHMRPGKLRGANGIIWNKPMLRASCVITASNDTYKQAEQHLSRAQLCSCGIYLNYDPAMTPVGGEILASCIAWGTIQLWPDGVMAQYCEIEHLWVPSTFRAYDVEYLRRRFGSVTVGLYGLDLPVYKEPDLAGCQVLGVALEEKEPPPPNPIGTMKPDGRPYRVLQLLSDGKPRKRGEICREIDPNWPKVGMSWRHINGCQNQLEGRICYAYKMDCWVQTPPSHYTGASALFSRLSSGDYWSHSKYPLIQRSASGRYTLTHQGWQTLRTRKFTKHRAWNARPKRRQWEYFSYSPDQEGANGG